MPSGVAGVEGTARVNASIASSATRRASIDAIAARLATVGNSGGIWVYEPPTAFGQKVALMFSTIVKLRAGSTVYFGAGGISDDEDEVALAMPAGTALELVVTSSEIPGAGSYDCTLRKEKVDTALAVTLTGGTDAARKGSDAGEVVYLEKNLLSMRLHSSDDAPDAIINVAVKYQFVTEKGDQR